MATLREQLETLCRAVEEARVSGGFLLSNGEVSDYWVPINRLRTAPVTDAVVGVLGTCIPVIGSKAPINAVAVPQMTTTSEDIFPWDAVLGGLRYSATTSTHERGPEFASFIYDRRRNSIDISPGAPGGHWLAVFTISVHSDMIFSVIDGLRRTGRSIEHVLVLLERERITRQRLQQIGVELVPFIVCDEDGRASSVLDLDDEPYARYHSFFVSS